MDIPTFTASRQTLTAPGGDIAYTEFGDGPAALFVHGLATSGALWRNVIEQLAATTRCVAMDLPAHGGSQPRKDASVAGMADAVAELCDGLGLGQVDLVGNDTGGAVAQIFAARHPERLRSLTLTNCDTEGNFPPPSFAPIVETARRGELAPVLAAIAGDPAQWPAGPLAVGYQEPARVAEDVWRAYYTPAGGTLDRALEFERILAALDPADLTAAQAGLAALTAPTLIVWGNADDAFGVEWAQQLRGLIPGARDVIEVDGAKLFFPDERPGDLVPHLRRHWGR
jgi:pimeloyl-ACP methyl ester carboxylesterase